MYLNSIALLLLTLVVRPRECTLDDLVYRGGFGRPTIINRVQRDVIDDADAAATAFEGGFNAAGEQHFAHRIRRSNGAAETATTTTSAAITTTPKPATAASVSSASPSNLQNVSGNITTKVSRNTQIPALFNIHNSH